MSTDDIITSNGQPVEWVRPGTNVLVATQGDNGSSYSAWALREVATVGKMHVTVHGVYARGKSNGPLAKFRKRGLEATAEGDRRKLVDPESDTAAQVKRTVQANKVRNRVSRAAHEWSHVERNHVTEPTEQIAAARELCEALGAYLAFHED